MAKAIVPLTATQIKNIKPKEKDYKIFDGGGLFLLVAKTGGKRWRLKYRFSGKEKVLALGTYPDISLKEAREKREYYRNLVTNNIDPSDQRKKEKKIIQYETLKKENTFLRVSQQWLKSYESEVSVNYHSKLDRALELYVYPFIKNVAIEDVKRLDIITILEYLRNKDLLETASRTLMILNKVFMYAVTYEYIPHNIIADIDKKVILGKIVKKHYPTFTKEKDK